MDRRHRLRSSRDFSTVFRDGARATVGPVSVAILRRVSGDSVRIGLAPRGARNAVRRNRTKRLLREAIRPCLERVPVGTDLVLTARRDLSKASRDDVARALHGALERVGLPC